MTPSADLERLSVRLCLQGFHPRSLVLPSLAGRGALRIGAGGAGARLVAQGDVWGLEGAAAGPSACVEYEVVVEALVAAGLAERHGADLLTQPGAWLLVPARFTPAEEARVELRLPGAMQASVPWAAAGPGIYRVPDTAFLFESRVAFGRFATTSLDVAGARFDIAVLDAPRRASDAGIERWVGAAARCVAALYGGRFPQARVQTLVEPVRASREPVVFGRALQAGGAAILLYLSASATDHELPLEWIAVHELTHLGMPWIVSEDAWLYEGFVTYYQETLRGRAGYFGAEGAWRALDEGFGRGRRQASDRSIAEESRLMQQRHAYHRVYWSGAALALRLDLALRAETRGRLSLDDVMRLWASEAFRVRRGWRALELLAEADRRLGTRACVASVRDALAESAFPETEPLFASLGITRGPDGRLAFAGDPALRATRQAIGGGE